MTTEHDTQNASPGHSRSDLLKLGVAAAVGMAVIEGAAPAVALAGEPDWLKNQEHVVDTYMTQFLSNPALEYPVSDMKDSLERRNIRERLLRFNKPDKVGYLYLMSFGKFVGYHVVKGKVSSVNSQMTPTNKTWDADGGSGTFEISVDSPGDDGSWGPNEGGDNGIFFFTPTGVMVETTLDWLYSDAPLSIDVPNLLGEHK